MRRRDLDIPRGSQKQFLFCEKVTAIKRIENMRVLFKVIYLINNRFESHEITGKFRKEIRVPLKMKKS